jgi:hypothetical protein
MRSGSQSSNRRRFPYRVEGAVVIGGHEGLAGRRKRGSRSKPRSLANA